VRVHFIGIGGIGLSALARLLKHNGYEISGSDIYETSITNKLRDKNISITIPHNKSAISNQELVIYSAVIKQDNPEIKEAKRKNIKIIDMYGNVLSENIITRLTDEPVYISGLKWSDNILAEAIYKENALRNWPVYQGNTENIKIICDARFLNKTIKGNIKVDIDDDFQVTPSKNISFTASPGKKLVKNLKIRIPFNKFGKNNKWKIIITDNRGVKKIYKKNFNIVAPFKITLSPIMNDLSKGGVLS